MNVTGNHSNQFELMSVEYCCRVLVFYKYSMYRWSFFVTIFTGIGTSLTGNHSSQSESMSLEYFCRVFVFYRFTYIGSSATFEAVSGQSHVEAKL